MNTTNYTRIIVLSILLVWFLFSNNDVSAQKQINILDQNISIIVENEPLRDVIKKICDQFNLDFDYNSKLIEGKTVNLSISNKTVRELLKELMKDFYLIFEIENNILIVRDYVSLSDHIDIEKLYNTPSEGFIFEKPSQKSISINFKKVSNLIIIPVSINGSDTMNFILDTGVKDPIITELTLVDELNLNYMKAIQLRGLGNEQVTQAYQSGDNSISLPGLIAKHQKINVILDENFSISQILGMPVHGLIGFNLFKHYIIKIDYNNEKIRLYKPQFFKYKPRKKDIVLAVDFVRGKPIINSKIIQEDGAIIPLRLLVDSGASDVMWLSTQTDSSLKIPSVNTYSFLGSGLGGELFGYKGRLNTLWVGGISLPNPIVSYPESEFINNIIVAEHRNGSIGGEFLRRFTVTFDYFNKRMILRPNSSLKDKFYYNMSGLEIINPIPGVTVYTINNIMENSPAWIAGLQKDDQIIAINNKSHAELTLNDINLMLRQKQDKKIKMTVLRNGEQMKTTFLLKETF